MSNSVVMTFDYTIWPIYTVRPPLCKIIIVSLLKRLNNCRFICRPAAILYAFVVAASNFLACKILHVRSYAILLCGVQAADLFHLFHRNIEKV